MLLDVFTRANRALSGAPLRLVGEGPERRAIERAIAARSLTGKVELLVLRDDVPDILAPAALFVSCSKVEGLPISPPHGRLVLHSSLHSVCTVVQGRVTRAGIRFGVASDDE